MGKVGRSYSPTSQFSGPESMSRSYTRMFNTILSGMDKVLGRTRVAAKPLRIHIEVNDFCNLRCPYCPRENPAIPKNTGNVPVETVRRLQPYMRSANYVGLAGNGEPFLHPNILEILGLITETGAAPAVITNGTRLKPEHIEKLPTLGPMLLMVSVDGGTKQTFEKWRKGADFDQVRASLKALNESKKKHKSVHPIVNFITCLMEENIDETEQVVEVAHEVGAAVIVFQTMYPYVESLNYLRVTDLKRVDAAVERARKKAGPLGIRIDYHPMSFDLDYREGKTELNEVGSIEQLAKRARGEETTPEKARLLIANDSSKGAQLAGIAAKPTAASAAATGNGTAAHHSPGNNGNGKAQSTPAVSAAAIEPPGAEFEATPPGPSGMFSEPARESYHCDNVYQQMHVTLAGDVKYCCFWTEGAVGNVLKDDLPSLWNSPAWDQVRSALDRGEKPVPCVGCYNLQRKNSTKIVKETVKELKDLWGQ